MIRTLSNSSPEAKNFLKFIRHDLQTHRVHLKFSKGRSVRFNNVHSAAGYFEEPRGSQWGIIRVGTGNRKPINVLTNLIHEYCHFLQWKNGDSIWKKLHDGESIEGASYVTLEEHTERDSLRLIREWHLPVNHSAIRKRSRAYIAYLRQESK